MMDSKNGYVRWWQLVTAFLGLTTIYVSLALAYNGFVTSNDTRIEAKVERTVDCFHIIDTRLARIEERLGITK